MKSPLKAVLFDLDGTLVDSEKDIAEAANHTRQHYGLARVSDTTIAQYVGNGVLVLLEKSLGTSDQAMIQEAYAVFQAYYRIHCADYTKPFPGTFELLNYLISQGLKLGVVSNKPQEFTDLVLEKLGLKPFFKIAYGPEATPNRKPHPEPLQKACKELGVKVKETIMIGDSVVDIMAAKAAPMRIAVLTHGYGTREILEANKPDLIADSLHQVMKFMHKEIEHARHRQSIFSFSANNPRRWKSNSKDLKTAADALSKEIHVSSSIYMLLIGFAFENLFKGILVSKNDKTQPLTDLLEWEGTGHDLNELADICKIELTEEEKDLLERISVFSYWRGRYPTPTNPSYYPEFIEGPNNSLMINSYFSSDDPKKINVLYEKLEKEI